MKLISPLLKGLVLLPLLAALGCQPANKLTNPPMNSQTSPAPSDEDFLGKSKIEAKALAKERGLLHRVVSEDGQNLPITKDMRPNRVNFDIRAGRVSAVKRF